MTKEEALKLMEKKGVFNKNQKNWEKEGQAEGFVEKMEKSLTESIEPCNILQVGGRQPRAKKPPAAESQMVLRACENKFKKFLTSRNG